ncbi:hypothetical protein O1R50_24665 [Glycomyces luteolus]|uniref:LPXTG cell wall anchor domain-containing protein n=1 Tax=Glycomyces luteolus TaxID=2670330 RepID=A0A9X3SVS3_9ACTN|nr:hypothetical protein [Glycomyces luteolus]MDA1362833.1 hypothetical protein [Glycomyces luteolus]
MSAAIGLAGATVLAAPAQAQGQWFPPALELTSATCNTDGEWELAWSLTDTTGPVADPAEYTYTVAEILTQIGADSGPWENAALEGTLQVGAVLPHTGEGSLTGVQTIPGDTERVKLKAQSDRTGAVVDDKRKEGRGLKNSLQHAVELGDCAVPTPPEPVEVPELEYGVGIVIENDVEPEPDHEDADAEWIVDFSNPAGTQDPSVPYEIVADTSTGDGTGDATVETGEVEAGDSTLRIPVTGPLEEVEVVTLELVVDGSEPVVLEAELPAVEPVGDPTASAAPDPSTPSDQAAQPALPTTGVPVAVTVGVAAALIAAGALAVNRGQTRKRHDGAC